MTQHLSFPKAIGWIMASMLVVSGGGYCFATWLREREMRKRSNPAYTLTTIVQTGPQREALKTSYLAELLGVFVDKQLNIYAIPCKWGEKKLRSSPLIKDASIKILPPHALYIDYTIRQPVAWIYEYPNIAVDEEGYLFPIKPFFSPKKLPQIYLGLAPFGKPSDNSDLPIAGWNRPLQGKHIELSLVILQLLSDPAFRDAFNVEWIDVSKAYAESFGAREIVIQTNDILGNEVISRLLRLSTKNYAQELSNYLELRRQLIEEERAMQSTSHTQVIDLRLPQLGYIWTVGAVDK